MDTYDLELAFYNKLSSLTYTGMKTLRPDEIFDPTKLGTTAPVRRGTVLIGDPQTVGFRYGAYTRTPGIYQIDLWLSRTTTSALKVIKQMSDAHLTHFFPVTGRGDTLTENTTSANITRRPNQRSFGREGAYLREMIEVEFFVDVDPS